MPVVAHQFIKNDHVFHLKMSFKKNKMIRILFFIFISSSYVSILILYSIIIAKYYILYRKVSRCH